MTVDPRTPCIIGVAQQTIRSGEGPAPEPLQMWEDVTRAAADDCGATGGGSSILNAADSLQVVYCMSWPYDAPVDRLAEALQITPRHRTYSGIGGTTPQVLVQESARKILNGDLELAVITGAEALETKRAAKRAGERLSWSFRNEDPEPFPFEAPFHPVEVAHNVFQAWLTFPMFDIARRAEQRIAPDAYQQLVGELLAPMSEVAATNPHAWFPTARTASELSTPTAENRMVGYPYTKRAVSIMDVDMAATVIVASHQKADELGVAADRRVYLRGWSYATDPTYVAEHPDLGRSPAMVAASNEALGHAGVDIDDVAHLDLYSCFASSVHFACDALGIEPAARQLTVTGGLPFCGGAGSNYMMHSIATMVDVLRSDEGSFGLVTGVGMHMTKHVFGVYSTAPPTTAPSPLVGAGVQAERDAAHPAVPIVGGYSGPGSVATYTVAHGREGSPDWGLVICDVPGGRTYGRVEDPDLLAALETEEWVGQAVQLREGDGGVNVAVAS